MARLPLTAWPMRLVSLIKTCTAHPAQWEGRFEDGTWLYVRFRHDAFSAGRGATIEEAVLPDVNGEELLCLDLDEDPWMPTERMLDLLDGIVRYWPVPAVDPDQRWAVAR